MSNPVIANIRKSLHRSGDETTPQRPPILSARVGSDPNQEIERLIQEINALSGLACRLNPAGLDAALAELVAKEEIHRACLWSTPGLKDLEIAARLSRLGVEIAPADADKHTLASCDLGVTEADFALPETGTLGLLSSSEKPRAVSLLPRIHLALVPASALKPDLHQVFAEAKLNPYLIFITGPSRTADIELTVTLGVHGPKALYAWILE